jgi:hypothetical protein
VSRSVPFSLRKVRSFRAPFLLGLLCALLLPAIATAGPEAKPLEATVTVAGLDFSVGTTSLGFGLLKYGDAEVPATGTIAVTNAIHSVPADFYLALMDIDPGAPAVYGADCGGTPITAEWTASGGVGPAQMVWSTRIAARKVDSSGRRNTSE